MIITIFLIYYFILPLIGLSFVFSAFKIPFWKAFIPIYNYFVWAKIINKPYIYLLFILLPYAFIFIYIVALVDTCFHLKINKWYAVLLIVVFPLVGLIYISQLSKHSYNQSKHIKIRGKTVLIAALIIIVILSISSIKHYWYETFSIPSSSMENTLKIGDLIFVSKITYGAKLPNTVLAVPITLNVLPLTKTTNSYLNWINLPYYRLPGFTMIKYNDVVVFNFPGGDTIVTKHPDANYYSLISKFGRKEVLNNINEFGNIATRPVDKREPYIKRCVGLPGDSFKINKQVIFINNKPLAIKGDKQYQYIISLKPEYDGDNKTLFKYIDKKRIDRYSDYIFSMSMTKKAAEFLSGLPNIKSIRKMMYGKGMWEKYIFPFDSTFKWNEDNYGPIWIPKKGSTITLTPNNLLLYGRCIETHEGNKVSYANGKTYLNGKISSTYTFKMNYYWMMGDNRDNSTDSRYWGFLPEDHIIGKAEFIWLSLDKNKGWFSGKIRFDRIFTGL